MTGTIAVSELGGPIRPSRIRPKPPLRPDDRRRYREDEPKQRKQHIREGAGEEHVAAPR